MPRLIKTSDVGRTTQLKLVLLNRSKNATKKHMNSIIYDLLPIAAAIAPMLNKPKIPTRFSLFQPVTNKRNARGIK
jgi:hypothetical protein